MESLPVTDRRSTTVPRNQHGITLIRWDTTQPPPRQCAEYDKSPVRVSGLTLCYKLTSWLAVQQWGINVTTERLLIRLNAAV